MGRGVGRRLCVILGPVGCAGARGGSTCLTGSCTVSSSFMLGMEGERPMRISFSALPARGLHGPVCNGVGMYGGGVWARSFGWRKQGIWDCYALSIAQVELRGHREAGKAFSMQGP